VKARQKFSVHDTWQYEGRGTWMPMWVFRRTEENDSGELILKRRTGRQLMLPGEWLIRDLNSKDPMWMTNRDFKREYEIP
jgi:hypothetical protein